MRYVVCVVHDRISGFYGVPHFQRSVGEAIRTFTDEINREAQDNQLYKHPDDFDLYSLGSFDGDSGLFDVGVPQKLIFGREAKMTSDGMALRAV